MMCANDEVHYYPKVVFVCLHITLPRNHHYADLPECTELLKCLSGTLCPGCVSKIKSILSIIFHAIYVAVQIQLSHFSYDDCENMCTLFIFIIKSKVWPICHYLGLGYETMICTVCLFVFLLNTCKSIVQSILFFGENLSPVKIMFISCSFLLSSHS